MKIDDTVEALRRMTAEIERLRGEVVSHRPDMLLSFRKAARLLGIDRGATLHALIKSGQLKTVRVGQRERIPMSEINRLTATGFDPAARRPRATRRVSSDSYEHPAAWKLKI